jgi:hypothetical protein
MASSKHPKGHPQDKDLGADTRRPPNDLRRNLGIGASKAAFSATDADPELIEGESTRQGDVLNDTTPQGDVNAAGRTNRPQSRHPGGGGRGSVAEQVRRLGAELVIQRQSRMRHRVGATAQPQSTTTAGPRRL